MATSRSSNIAPRTRTFPPTPLPTVGFWHRKGVKIGREKGVVFGYDVTRMLVGGTSMLRA